MANTKGAANYGSAAAPAGAPVAATVGTPVTNPVGGNFRFTNDIQGTGAHRNWSIFCRHHYRCDKSVYVGRCLKWFWMQEEDIDTDADPNTSEGIFVLCGSKCPGGLTIGDLYTSQASFSL